MQRTLHLVQADAAATLAPLGLRRLTFAALAVIVDSPGLRQTDLARALAIEPPNMVPVVDELVRRGLVARERDTCDRRASQLIATEPGQRLCARAARALEAHDARMLAGLSAEARMALSAALLRIEENASRRG
ncbi:MarR family winged helix-turn-helix transcriptional regulator [Oceaniglobus roseus]|uniref:MarR family winged helix-turn-helix transcriptional regulator n=1 Tax=Oceaniglobus roseus TaxID=1737570 RepID=UPI001FECAC83|nr:MarR family transcriptional regulator [Kandeliimicrobium roseum]